MRKSYKICFLLLIPFLFVSCVDYVQAISYKDGNYQVYYKVTFSKFLFAMAGEDPEAMVNDLDEEVLSGLPEDVMISPINTELEVGIECSLAISPRTTNEDERKLLPTTAGNKYFIPFLVGNDESDFSDSIPSDSSDLGMTEAIMSSVKCRVLIAKNIIPAIESAYLEGRDGPDYLIPVFDYGNSYCIEIPFMVLSSSNKFKLDRIIVVKPLR